MVAYLVQICLQLVQLIVLLVISGTMNTTGLWSPAFLSLVVMLILMLATVKITGIVIVNNTLDLLQKLLQRTYNKKLLCGIIIRYVFSNDAIAVLLVCTNILLIKSLQFDTYWVQKGNGIITESYECCKVCMYEKRG